MDETLHDKKYHPVLNHPPLGTGNFGQARLMFETKTGKKVAIKYIPRGKKLDENVVREIHNHAILNHPNIVRFIEVLLTPTDLAIVMEYASGGELFDRVLTNGRMQEDEARYFFQQLISGVDYCHSKGVAHRDLKLENALIDNSHNNTPRLKICDFGYSKHSLIDSAPKSAVGTPAYIAPEVLKRQGQYDGRAADVWSCGVTLYVMLCGRYPFEDKTDPKNFRKTVKRILNGEYGFPSKVALSEKCRELLAGIFQVDVAKRLTMEDIKKDEWFNVNLPSELFENDDVSASSHASKFEPMDRELLTRIVEKARETPSSGGDSFGSNNYEARKDGGDEKNEENRQPPLPAAAAADNNNRMSKAMSVDEYMEMEEDFH
ncbi:unnamed protein product [Bathycoccus prasinos]